MHFLNPLSSLRNTDPSFSRWDALNLRFYIITLLGTSVLSNLLHLYTYVVWLFFKLFSQLLRSFLWCIMLISILYFQLLDSCLKSPLLPAYLAASFAKKLSRLALTVPPSGSLIIIALIHNLLRRHPSINCLVHQVTKWDSQIFLKLLVLDSKFIHNAFMMKWIW